ncbi:MAG: prephenate dehydrogenase/arogenate dehydrogenase family protein [Methylomonas sp.]|nr:prephenate dehydrogenase/arogenate dehydrogenase family protein [Methylomonas sp.]PPD22655.1 MAG: prephenate dehydrogenase [Methylomonas sp.]PPD27967.1 MAG: prephenate dehydrogenase [Methylomonas sp.]PPD40076.1 MAG: prephenate dehydrogenase [Methylomonas sp.]PPD41537.1 MAG: prephenate dehydrogenase [Methylomonas sp.]
MFEQLCIIGVGLIGGSIARAAKAQGLCKQVVAYGGDKHLPNLQRALALGVIDGFHTDIGAALNGSDCVIVATPVGTLPAIFSAMQPFWNSQTIYSDVGSTKASVVEAARSVFGDVPSNFVPAHPIAGAERSGVEASTADLFNDRRLIITPLDDTDTAAVEKLSEFWRRIGSRVALMSVEHHDTVLAATSHLPHILAFALVAMLGRKDEQHEIFKYAAGGFKDFSRIASSDPTMWRDICLANKDELIPLLQQFQAELGQIERRLQNGDAQALFDTFSYARQARQRFLDTFDDHS